MSGISQAEILSTLQELHTSAAAPCILREHEVRARTEQNTPYATSSNSPETRASGGPRSSLGNKGELPQTAPDTQDKALDLTDPAALYEMIDRWWAGEEDRLKRDAAGWELLQTSADADLARKILYTLQNMMENGILTKTGGLANCGVRPIPESIDGVQLVDSKGKKVTSEPCIHCYNIANKKSFAFVGLQHCSSPLRCPVCGRKLSYIRRIQVAWGVRRMIESGHVCIMLTLTAPHSKKTAPKVFVNSFCEAKRIFQKSTVWKKITKSLSYAGQIAGAEVTVDAPWSTKKTGIHFHSHNLNFYSNFPEKKEEIEEITKQLAEAWTNACEKMSLVTNLNKDAHLKHGLNLSLAEPDDMQGERTAAQAADYLSKGVAFEVAPAPGTKEGRRPDRINQWQLMRLVTSSHPELANELDITLQALAGRNAVVWSAGLKALCCVPDAETILSVLSKYSSTINEHNSESFENAVEIEKKSQIEQNEIQIATETEEENEEEPDESKENELITSGESGEELIKISLRDWAVIRHYAASHRLLQAIPTTCNILEAARVAKNAIYLIGLGIDPVDGSTLTAKGDYMSLIGIAQAEEARRAACGLENTECIHLGPPLLAPEALQTLIAQNQQARAATAPAPTLEQLF